MNVGTKSVTEPAAAIARGLEGVVATQTRLSHVDGQAGELTIAGFPLQALASQATFEEMLFLLWHDRLPTAPELADLKAELAGRRSVPAVTSALLTEAAQQRLPAMDALGWGLTRSAWPIRRPAIPRSPPIRSGPRPSPQPSRPSWPAIGAACRAPRRSNHARI